MTAITQKKPVRLWILGLHHSGTTIFWRAWRKDHRFLCFDEPLTGDIGLWFPKSNSKQTNAEYINIFGGDPKKFWRLYAPKEAYQELDQCLSRRQERWLSAIVDRPENVVIDETHLHFHLPTVKKLTPDSYVIHLYRRAKGFITSHLLPSGPQQNSLVLNVKGHLGNIYRRRRFWEAMEIPHGMERDKVIGHHPESKFGLRLAEAGYDVDRIMRGPAIVRLLAYWHYSYHHMEREGKALFGEKFRTMTYESFAKNPGVAMRQLYDWIHISAPKGATYDNVYAPKQPFQAKDPRWQEAARVAGFREEELERLL